MKFHLQEHAEILAYCLSPNHFHILLLSKENLKPNDLNSQISILLRSYTRAINIQENRTGSLFQQKTKCKNVNDYGLLCMNYIHQNPYKAGFVKKLEDWEYSSFREYISGEKGICDCKVANELFKLESKEEFYKLSYENISEDNVTKIEGR